MPERFQIKIGQIQVEVSRKPVKNLNLRVCPSSGTARMSIPARLPVSEAEKFVWSKREWLEKHLTHRRQRLNTPERRVRSGEIHPLWGENRPISIENGLKKSAAFLDNHGVIRLQVSSQSSDSKRYELLDRFYRDQLNSALPALIKQWEPVMGVEVREFGIKKMKTRWGSCNIRDHRVWLNLNLAEKPRACLEYVLVHEMTHLHERLHNKRFYRLMDKFMPDWRYRDSLLKGNSG
jgi:predicted metal-dependent hydrolase